MAEKISDGIKSIFVDLGSPNSEPQWQFFLSKVKYTCYGGARGGGKSWAIIRKALLLAFYYSGIQILVVRREYDQLENPIIQPMLKLLQPGTHTYNKTEHLLTLINGSKIKFSNMPDYSSTVEGKFQGNNWDILFIDEGFGTLDEKSLESVMGTLEKLQEIAGQSNRRVGIISHREELYERIPTQIQVKRRGEGRSIVEIVNND